MQVRLARFFIFIISLSFCTVFGADNPFAENSVLYQIENDYLHGVISLDDKVIFQINSIKRLDKTPIKYASKSQVQSEHELREATLALIQIRTAWDELEQNTKAYVNKALARASTEFTIISSNGYFKLHYDTSGINAIPILDTDLNSIPDFVEQCASYCDSTLAKHLEMGYLLPPTDNLQGGDSLYDIYFEEMSFYGYAVPEAIGSYSWNDYYSYVVLNNNFIDFPLNTDPEGNIAGAAKVTVAHEFQHAVQFGYDINEDIWAMESEATFLEEVIFDEVNDNYNYLDDFMDFPHTSLMNNTGLHKYGSFIWPIYLALKFDTLIHVAAWEAARYGNLFDAYTDTLLNNYGWNLDSAYVDFTYWMFNTASNDDGLHFTEGSSYYPLAISASHFTYPVVPMNSPVSIGGYGAGYVTFFPSGEMGKLKITFNGSNTRNWKAYIIKSSSINSHEIEFIDIDSISKLGDISIQNIENYYSVTLVGVNIDEYSSSVLYTYSAEIIPQHEVSSSIILPVDSAIYSGGTRTYEIKIRNTALINDIYNLIYWDTKGWLPFDTFALAISAGDSAIVEVNVSPPQGTPIGELSILSFKAESWGDSTIYETQTRTGQTYLFYGDVNSSGIIDISDIVALVSYSFENGPEPLPVLLSADFNCSDNVDISDLVDLVNYMFASGAYPACNPY